MRISRVRACTCIHYVHPRTHACVMLLRTGSREKTGVYVPTAPRVSTLVPFIIQVVEVMTIERMTQNIVQIPEGGSGVSNGGGERENNSLF